MYFMHEDAMYQYQRAVSIPIAKGILEGELTIPPQALGTVVFAHGSGSSRHSARNQYVARVLQEAGIATLLFDLLLKEEDMTRATRFDINLLTDRLIAATQWLRQQPQVPTHHMGYFGASTGAAAALRAAAVDPEGIQVVVSRGGRPDLAGDALSEVHAAVLLIVGGNDEPVIALNQSAYEELPGDKKLIIIPGATHLFEEAGALEEVARLAAVWLKYYLLQ